MREISLCPLIGGAYLRWAIRVGYGLSATALPATRSEVTNPAIGIGGTQYRQEYISEFSESSLSEQCNIQHQWGFPQSIQFRLGRQTPYRGWWGVTQPQEDNERLKNLSTTLSYKVEAKGKDRDEIAFFAKFVLCSNNEYLPVIIDAGETRYWVRKINRLQSDDTNFLQRLKAEIPAFLHFLTNRELSTERRAECGSILIVAYRSVTEDNPQ